MAGTPVVLGRAHAGIVAGVDQAALRSGERTRTIFEAFATFSRALLTVLKAFQRCLRYKQLVSAHPR